MTPTSTAVRSLLMAIALGAAGCGYTTLSALPAQEGQAAGASTLAVTLLENETTEPLLGEIVTRRLKTQLAVAGPWRIVNASDQPAWLLNGRVTGVKTIPMAFDADSRATEYRLELRVDLTLTRTADGAVLWSGRELIGAADYYANRDAIATRQAKERSFHDAGQRLADLVAHQLSLSLMAPPSPGASPAAGR